MKDEIIEELLQVKDQITAESHGNTQELFNRLRKIKLKPTQRIVNRTSMRKPEHA